jgi:uncharacterized Zn finger protein (UPF0148 family)
MIRFYDCPKCGKHESSWDGESYCGSCEEEFRSEQEEEDDEKKRPTI